MVRLFFVFWMLLSALAAQAFAQSAVPGLRGSETGFADSDTQEAEESSGQVRELNPAQSNVFALRPGVNSAEAEDGSTGLGAGRVSTPIRPFSDRLAAVARTNTSGNGGLDDSVFGGDTTFDQAEGFRLGTFTLTPELTITGNFSDNISQSASGTGGREFSVSPDLSVTSDWSRHELNASLRGSYNSSSEEIDGDDYSLAAAANLRLDISRATTGNSAVSYTYFREDGSSADSPSATTHVSQYSGSVGITQDAGRVAATLSLGADRSTYTTEDSSSDNGRNNTVYSASLRLQSVDRAVFLPFAEGSLLLRRFDESCSDSLCERRDANGYEFRGGLTIASGPKLSGEVSAGWRVEKLEDNRLNDLSGLLLDASIAWSPTRLTSVTAGLGTSFSATDLDTSAGSITHSGDLRVAHAFSDRLVGETGLGYSRRTFEGLPITEKTTTGFAGATFAVTRNVAITGRYTHRRFDSSQSGSDYTENSVEAGLRIRR